MARKKLETFLNEPGITDSGESPQTTVMTENPPPPSESPAVTTEPVAESLPNPVQGQLTVEPPSKRRGRPPGSKNRTKGTGAQAAEATAAVLPPEMLQAVTVLYSNLLVRMDLGPELNQAEQQAIQLGLNACAQKWATKLEHAPEAILIAAVVMPVVPRMMARNERRESDPTWQRKLAEKKEREKAQQEKEKAA